jgi:DNA-binding beta-propeller fold protein YncE
VIAFTGVAHAGAAAKPSYAVESVAIPNAPPGGLFLDYLALDRGRGRVWVPAGGTGTTLVIDAKSLKVHRVDNFKTAEVERRGQKRIVGPSSASVGDGFVYVGNRGDSSVCAIDAVKLTRAGCVTLPGSPDGVAYVAKTKEVWVTTPRDQSIVVLDVSKPAEPKVATTFKLDGSPEGYAVDDAHGVFYTNLEDKDETVRIDLAAKKVTATWPAQCGEEGPGGLALDPSGRLLMNVCRDHVEVMDGNADGKVLSKLDTGEGVDAIDYVPSTRLLYAAAARAGKLTIAHVANDGALTVSATVDIAQGARNAVATDDGTAFVADGPDGKVLVVRPTRDGK